MHRIVVVQWVILATVFSIAVYGGLTDERFLPIAVYAGCWTCFHTVEYVFNVLYTDSGNDYLFLLYGARGSWHLLSMTMASLLEFAARRIWYRSVVVFPWSGSILALAGIFVRAQAIRTCGLRFNHYIETDACNSAELVTNGVYSWCRHPSYLGFLLYVAGMQVILGNVLTTVLCGWVLYRFFTQRIRFEEYFLVEKTFGQAYLDYKSTTAALIPYVW